MIKKFLHYICVAVACALWICLLALVYQFVILMIFKVDSLSLQTYHALSGYWNDGGVLKGKDILLLLMIFSYFPVCFYGCYRLYHYKYLKLLTVPLNKLANRGLDGYVAPDVNIKNLKIEEKKTLEQIVQERINLEKKKNPQNEGATDMRRKIIEKIEEAKK